MEMINKRVDGRRWCVHVMRWKDRIIISHLENGVSDRSTMDYDDDTWRKLKEMYCLEETA